jgi:nucleoside-diphosphate-sugar epimerase
MSRALLIGGTGQIGWATAQNLLEHGWDVTIASRTGGAGPAGTTAIALDRSDTTALLAAADQADLVMDAVAYGPEQGEQLAQLAGHVGSLVVISTASVYAGANGSYLDIADSPLGFPDFPVPVTERSHTVDNAEQTYSPMKAALERQLLAVDGLPVSFLRPGAIHGAHSPFLREWYFAKRALDRREHAVLAFDGESRFGTSATVNVAELVRLCAEQPGSRVLNAADEEAPSVSEIAATVFELLDHACELVLMPGPPRDGLGGTPWSVPSPFVQSMAAARAELGYTPVATYREAVGPALEWFIDAAARAEASGGSWRSAFPRMIERYGADDWFGYEAEDAYVRGLK